MVGRVRFERTTNWLKANCSTYWANDPDGDTAYKYSECDSTKVNGGSCAIRTHDQLVKSQLLYLLS